MIPQRLHLKNFLSYGPYTQTIDFQPYHLVCLSGKNGHGKSALLDAMTWAIWGSARKTTGATKADDGLLRLGQTHMVITFEFVCNQTQYRVRREYIRNSARGETRLYLGMYDEQEQRFRSLTENTAKATQQVIHKVVGLDYESFTNSVFIRQGNANAFSRKSPKERKEILGTILGLEQYEQYKKRAQEYVKARDQSINQLQTHCNQLQQEIADKETLQQKQATYEQELRNIEQQEQQLLNHDQSYQEQDHTYAQHQYTVNSLNERYQHLRTHYNEQKEQLQSFVSAWRETFRTHRTTSHHDIETQYHNQKAYVERLDQQYNTYYKACEHVRQAEQAATDRKNELYQQFLQQAHDARTQLSQQYTQLQTISHQLNECQKQLNMYEAYYEQTKQNLHVIHNALIQYEDQPDDISYLLEQQIYQAGRLRGTQRIINAQAEHATSNRSTQQNRRLEYAQSALKARINDTRQRLEHVRKHAQEQQEYKHRIHTYEEHLHQYLYNILTLRTQYKQHERAYQEADTTYRKLESHNKAYEQEDAFSRYLDNDTTYNSWLQQAETWRPVMHNNAIDYDTYHNAYNTLRTLQEKRNAQSSSYDYRQLQHERRTHIRTIINTLKQLKHEASQITQQLSQYTDITNKRNEIQQQRNHIQSQLEQLRHNKERMIQEKGAITQQIRTIEEKEKTYRETQQHLSTYYKERSEYAHIAQAFSRDGIQALLIENAIPEIEQEANTLLRQLTDNQSQLFIESLRDLKSGKTKETLDIKISDSMGIRPYELFSGGEAFRIDFAIRVAISQLLARRAGTQLQTLIIDEGFGSQDEDGLHHIMDAIYKIQDHFSKIIVVSHLPSLKGQFPAQFLIHKGPHGSSVNVYEQG